MKKQRQFLTRTARCWPVGLLLFTLSLLSAHAERYLTADEARKLCFPKADRFEERVARFTDAQKKSIASKSRVAVLNRGQRYWLAYHDTNFLGVLVADHVLGKHEIIDYAIAIAPAGEVSQVEILEYRESHGYEVRNQKWRDQFRGKNVKSKLRLNDDIYNISGATISCRQVTEGVKRVLATYELVLRPALPGGSVPDQPARKD
jgi:Na+-translocating ferredoxin:NAD+ oxidoreductase RnfG subunit